MTNFNIDKCDCGGRVARTGHSDWCSGYESNTEVITYREGIKVNPTPGCELSNYLLTKVLPGTSTTKAPEEDKDPDELKNPCAEIPMAGYDEVSGPGFEQVLRDHLSGRGEEEPRESDLQFHTVDGKGILAPYRQYLYARARSRVRNKRTEFANRTTLCTDSSGLWLVETVWHEYGTCSTRTFFKGTEGPYKVAYCRDGADQLHDYCVELMLKREVEGCL